MAPWRSKALRIDGNAAAGPEAAPELAVAPLAKHSVEHAEPMTLGGAVAGDKAVVGADVAPKLAVVQSAERAEPKTPVVAAARRDAGLGR